MKRSVARLAEPCHAVRACRMSIRRPFTSTLPRDVGMARGEDSHLELDCNGTANVAAVRLLRQNQTRKRGVKNRRLQSALDPDYLLNVLASATF